jgi:hypothetical protein
LAGNPSQVEKKWPVSNSGCDWLNILNETSIVKISSSNYSEKERIVEK